MFDIPGFLKGDAGAAQLGKGTTVQTLVISVSTGALLFIIQFVAFLILRLSRRLAKIYQPRSYLITARLQSPHQPRTPWAWIESVFRIPDTEVIDKCGLDAYLFLRYLRMCFLLFLPLALLILPILLPINAVGGKHTNTIHGTKYNVTGLDVLTWSNVSPEQTSRYWAHLVLALVVIGFSCYTFHGELLNYIDKRQKYLASPAHRLRASATTVLVTGIPPAYRSQKALEDLYDVFPGGLRRIWVNRDLNTLRNKVLYRHKLINHLENAETNLIRNAMRKAKKKHLVTPDEPRSSSENRSKLSSSDLSRSASARVPEKSAHERLVYEGTTDVADLKHDIETDAAWLKYLSPKARDTIRILRGGYTFWSSLAMWWLVTIPFTKKVDRIYFCRREIARLNQEISRMQREATDATVVNSAFIQFNHQIAAHMACQTVSHDRPLQMANRLIEIAPSDVLWYNLSSTWWERAIGYAGFLVITTGLLIVYAILSAFTGVLSRLSTLGNATSWLRWIQSLPRWLQSFIQGTLPAIILHSLLSGLLPWFLRLLLRNLVRNPTRTTAEKSLQLWYFFFLVIILFLVPTISAGLTGIVSEIINHPTNIPELLATDLPSAANYYFSYLILQALSLSATAALQFWNLTNVFIWNPLGTNTARDRYTQSFSTHKYKWGNLYPWYSIFAVIGLVYSVIAPLMLVFMLVTYSLFWIVSKNNLVYVVRNSRETGGRYFPRAVTQLFVGLYFLEVALIGLFFLVRDVQNNVVCTPQAVIMIVALIITVAYHYWQEVTLSPLFTYLPITLEDDAVVQAQEFEVQRLTSGVDVVDVPDAYMQDELGEEEDSAEPTTQQSHDGSIESMKTREVLPSFNRRSSHGGPSHTSHRSDQEYSVNQQIRDREAAKAMLAELDRDQATPPRSPFAIQHAKTPPSPLDITLASPNLNQGPAQLHDGPTTPPPELDPDLESEGGELKDPVEKIVGNMISQLDHLAPKDVDKLTALAFEDPALRSIIPIAWVPHDDLGIAEDEIKRTEQSNPMFDFISDRNAYFAEKGKAMFDGRPPDYTILNDILPNL